MILESALSLRYRPIMSFLLRCSSSLVLLLIHSHGLSLMQSSSMACQTSIFISIYWKRHPNWMLTRSRMLGNPLHRDFLFIHLLPHHPFERSQRLGFTHVFQYVSKLGNFFTLFAAGDSLSPLVIFALNNRELDQLIFRQGLERGPTELICTRLV